MIFFLTINDTLAKTQLAQIASPSPKKEKAKAIKNMFVQLVEKYNMSCTASKRMEPKMEIYLLMPILSTRRPEGILRMAAEKQVTIIISPAVYSEYLNLVIRSPLAPSKKGMYIPKLMVHIRFKIQNEYFNSFKSSIRIVYLWSQISGLLFDISEDTDDESEEKEEFIFPSKRLQSFQFSYQALFIILMKRTAIMANIEHMVQKTTDMKNGAPRFSSKSSQNLNEKRLFIAFPISGKVITIPKARAMFFLLNKQETRAACAVIKLQELIPKNNLPISIILYDSMQAPTATTDWKKATMNTSMTNPLQISKKSIRQPIKRAESMLGKANIEQRS